MNIETWLDVLALLGTEPWGTRLQIAKGILPHPLAMGMTESMGLPEGQRADYRLVLPERHGLHVKEFDDHYEAHLDEVHPDIDPVEHLRQDAPELYVGGAVALGAIVGGVIGKTWKSGLAGAAIAGVVGALLAAAAEADDEGPGESRPRGRNTLPGGPR